MSELTTVSKIDCLERQMLDMPPGEAPLTHRFVPGLYAREIFLPAGTVITSLIHKTEHLFILSQGIVSVYTEGEGEVIVEAPYTGITKPGTRRAVLAHTDAVWTTFHPNPDNITDLEELARQVVEIPDNPLLEGADPARLNMFKQSPNTFINRPALEAVLGED